MSLQPGLRIIPQLRAAHLHEIDAFAPRRLLYFDLNYDMRDVVIPAHAERVSRLRALLAVATQSDGTLELAEPLWIEYVTSWLVLATTWRLTRFGRSRTPGVVFFAIENNDPSTVLDRGRRWLRPLAKAALWMLRHAIPRLTARCVFGTRGAADAYRALTRSPVETRLIWDLPMARDVDGDAPVADSSRAAVFVGALESRKGIEPLLAAWSEVEERKPDAHLTIIGDGPLRDTVAAWSLAAPDSRTWLGLQKRNEVVRVLAQSTTLAAPSVRSGRWREQVGRPILEALSCGLTVVTTSESGLSEFLRVHGHRVIDTPLACSQLRGALCDALDHPLPRNDVRDSLPSESGRIVADRWLHGGS